MPVPFAHHTLLTLLLIGALLPACNDQTSSDAAASPKHVAVAPAATPQDPASKYLALGDSYTIGESVAATERYPVLLADLLRKQGVDLGPPTIIARTGWTTHDLLNAVAAQKPTGPFHLVTILIGVNNQFQHRSIDEYRAELAELLKQSIELAGGRASHVVAISIPDWGVTPFGGAGKDKGVSDQIDAFNRTCAEECERAGVVLVDVTPISRTVPEHPDLIANDGLHPSGKMYAMWADATTASVKKAVESK